ncbi:hypothetical protein [Phenylobacterium sp.]|jgi:hypothetical protein|uniref:hypothetical protein n=1 Tax=Phenylobacterium sp. TaxID=1871053 RepID=UPI002F42C705
MKTETFGILVLCAVGAFVLALTLVRMHEGRCAPTGGRGGLNCTYPARAQSAKSRAGAGGQGGW